MNLEILCIDVTYNDFRQRFITAYRPPTYNVQQTQELFDYTNNLCDVNCVVTICGDFNFPNINWAKSIDVSVLSLHDSMLANFVLNTGLSQLVNLPTRESNILDLLMVSDPLAVFDVDVQQPFSTSDHGVVSWRTWFPGNDPCNAYDKYLDFKHANYAGLAEHLSSVNWLQLFTCIPPNNVEGIWQIIKSVIIKAIALYVHRRVACSKPIQRYPLHIQRAIKRKRALWRLRRCAGGSARYAVQAHMCKRLIKRYLANKERHLLNSKSLASLYKHVNAKLSSSRGVAPLRVNNIELVDDEEKAQAFNNYFSSVFTRPLNEINTGQLNSACPIFSNIIDFSPRLTYEALLKAKSRYSVGPDLLPSILWVKFAAQLALPVSILFNTSYHFATLPSDWKGANVLPLFKKAILV